MSDYPDTINQATGTQFTPNDATQVQASPGGVRRVLASHTAATAGRTGTLRISHKAIGEAEGNTVRAHYDANRLASFSVVLHALPAVTYTCIWSAPPVIEASAKDNSTVDVQSDLIVLTHDE